VLFATHLIHFVRNMCNPDASGGELQVFVNYCFSKRDGPSWPQGAAGAGGVGNKLPTLGIQMLIIECGRNLFPPAGSGLFPR
jgi:hypothetical protein